MSEKDEGMAEAETEKKSLLFETRISFRKLTLWIVVVIIIIAAFSNLERKYPIPTRDFGFKFAYRTPAGYLYVFSYGMDGINFIDAYDYVYSDLDCYFLAKYNTNITVIVALFDKENNTNLISKINRTITVKFFEFTKFTIELPKIDKMLIAILYINGEEILRFYYRYNVYYERVTTILGEIFISQIIYMLTALIVYIVALIVAKNICRITPVPEANLTNSFLSLIVFGFLLYYILRIIILEYGLYQAIYFYPLLFIIALFSALYVVSPEAKRLLLLHTNFENTMIEVTTIDTRIIRNNMYKVPSTLEFILYKPLKIVPDKREFIFKAISEEFSYVIYYRDIIEKNDVIEIKCSDVHALRLEDYKTNIQKIYAFSQAIEALKEKVKNLEVNIITRTGEDAIKIVKKLIGVKEK